MLAGVERVPSLAARPQAGYGGLERERPTELVSGVVHGCAAEARALREGISADVSRRHGLQVSHQLDLHRTRLRLQVLHSVSGATGRAIASPTSSSEPPGRDRGRGRVRVLRGAPAGLASRGNELLGEESRGVSDRRAPRRAFGAGVSVLDTDGRTRPELVIGVPGRPNGDGSLGAVTVIRHGRARMHSLRTLRLTAPEAPDSSGAAAAFG